MPMSQDFSARLRAVLPDIVAHFGTPFHIYDAQGIRDTCASFDRAFTGLSFQEHFAVKALPNPAVLRIVADHGFGFDVSSLPELSLAVRAGATGQDICFTSNNTSAPELAAALDADALITVDDEAVLDRLTGLCAGALRMPELLCFRVNPGELFGQDRDTYLGDPVSAKFGVPVDRLPRVCAKARAAGVRAVGLHMMVTSNSLRLEPVLLTLDLLLAQATRIAAEVGVAVPLLNLGGGIGIPYRPHERRFDLSALGAALRGRLAAWPSPCGAPRPELRFECGRVLTGPHGVLVTRVINRMSKWREYVGVDASSSALLRSAIYPNAYHHITAPLATGRTREVVDVVGALCENSDKLGTQRELPALGEGDVVLVHDTGAHGHAMGFNYNGRLRPQELLLHPGGEVELIRRAETEQDLFATLRFPQNRLIVPEVTARPA
jgi:diaminopimelate decarboxylase